MKIVSWNVNGIRASYPKGYHDFLENESPDILCLQETKAHTDVIPDHIQYPNGYYPLWVSGEKKGYSGVAILSKHKPLNTFTGMGIERFDNEGRIACMEFDQYYVFSVYFPNGQKNDERLQYKLDFYEAFFDFTNELISSGKHVIICGDYNTAHNEIDLANPKANANYSGFLPVERAWMDRLIQMKYVDTFRHFDPSPEQYTWWTYRFGARKRNIGWRIDYVFVNEAFLPTVKQAFIRPDIHGSDHCPVGIEI